MRVKKYTILVVAILASLVLFATEVLSVNTNKIGWIMGRTYDAVTGVPLSGVKIEVRAHIMDKLADGTFRLRGLDETNPIGITLLTDDQGEFSVEVFLNNNFDFFKIIAQLDDYEEAQDTLFKIESNKTSTIDLPLIPLNLTQEQLEILDQKHEQEKQKLYQDNPSFVQDLTEWSPIFSSLAAHMEGALLGSSQQITFSVPDEIYVCDLNGFTGWINFNDFISGVVSAEMGESFPVNALKAQSVASRSYALEKYYQTSCANFGQAYKSQIGKKSRDATMNTTKIVILYSGNVIPAYFSARCNGDATLNSEDGVWHKPFTCDVGGNYVPYARSQSCSGHKNCSSTKEAPCCHVFTGSRWVYIYGHGVGMCQRGAQDFANQGKDWQWILLHFYTDVKLANLPIAQQPNLRPYQPSGWSDSIVVTKSRGTYTDSSPLYTTDTLYVDWAVINDGQVATPQGFSVALYIDGILKNTWSYPLNACLKSNGYWPIKDYPIGKLIAGIHTLRLVADSEGVITETNEGDNEYTKTITVQAPITKCTFTLTTKINPSGSGTITKNPDKAAYCSGEVVTLTAIPNSGYSFKSWSGVDSSNGTTATVTMNKNRTVTATFITYTLKVNISPSGSGTITKNPDKATYCSGDVVTLTAIPNSGYSFKSWSGVDSSDGTTATVTMTKNRTVTANFIKATKTVCSVVATPSSWTFTSPGTKQLTAVANYCDNTTEDVTAKATWTSSNSNVAHVSNSGLVTSGQNGSAVITATYGGKKGACSATVNITSISGQLSLRFEPNPAQQSSSPCLGVTPAWWYTSFLTETAGVGVTITRFTWDFYDGNGNYLNTQTNTDVDFANWFLNCGPGSVYIPPKGTACGYLCANLNGRGSGSVVMNFYGKDDLGHEVSVSMGEGLSGLQSMAVKGNNMNFTGSGAGTGGR